ncbi:MAG: hypothetical protein QF515_15570 [Pseudomonadales bacterium]|nr:hypothetical protein [Pseudomonadales bacterium]
MLRESGRDVEGLNLHAIVKGSGTFSGVPCGEELVAFVEAALTGTPELATARQAAADALGAQALVDAAAVIGNFQRMTRIADSTGIAVDERTAVVTEGMRAELGLNEFVSARLPL